MKINFMGVTLTDDVMTEMEMIQNNKEYRQMLFDGLTALNDIVLEYYELSCNPTPMETMDHLLTIRDLRKVLNTISRPKADPDADLEADLDDEADLTAYLQSTDHNIKD